MGALLVESSVPVPRSVLFCSVLFIRLMLFQPLPAIAAFTILRYHTAVHRGRSLLDVHRQKADAHCD